MATAEIRSIIAAAGSDLERAFDTNLMRFGQDMPGPLTNFEFDPPSRFAFDRAWPQHRVAVELEGGVYGAEVRCHNCGSTVRAVRSDGTAGKPVHLAGGHLRFHRYISDRRKYNRAQVLGWIVLSFVREDIHGQPFEMIELIREVLTQREPFACMVENLSQREDQVLHFIAAGFRASEIAPRIGIAQSTVERHVASLCTKLVARSRASAVARAAAWGLLDARRIPWPQEVSLELTA